jgi:hypothetical protein
MTTITAQEIEQKLSGLTSKKMMLALLENPGQTVDSSRVNEILDYDQTTAAILEQLVADGICRCETNRWWPSQYRALRAALAAEEFAKIRPMVQSRNTGAEICLKDPKSGNTVIVAIAAPTVEAIWSAAKSAKKQMAERKKETASRIAGERIANSM